MRPQPFRNELVAEPISVKDGCIELSERPGLGVELIPRAVEKYRADR
jgi:L-alanine-DL-glutamate epimerase-like enolase superfamily enzyme